MNNDKLDELKEMTKNRSHCPYFYKLVEELVGIHERSLPDASEWIDFTMPIERSISEEELIKMMRKAAKESNMTKPLHFSEKLQQKYRKWIDKLSDMIKDEDVKDDKPIHFRGMPITLYGKQCEAVQHYFDIELLDKVDIAINNVRARIRLYPTITIGTIQLSKLFKEELSKEGIEE